MRSAPIAGMSVLLLALGTAVFAQPGRGSFGFGLSGGVQQLIGDAETVRPGISSEGFFVYRFTDRVSVHLSAGYGKLPYDRSATQKNLSTELITGNLFFDFELMNAGFFRPFIGWGIGGFNFKGYQFGPFWDGEGILGAGARFFAKPGLAFFISAQGKYTTGDDLDMLRGGRKDMYASVRAGFVWYKIKKDDIQVDELFTEKRAPVEEVAGDPELLNKEEPVSELADQAKGKQIEQPGAAPAELFPDNSSSDALLDLQNQINMLKEELARKDEQIEKLRKKLSVKNKRLEVLEKLEEKQVPETITESRGWSGGRATELQKPTPQLSPGVAFKTNYNVGLELFGNRQYLEAVQIFQNLLDREPLHPLASNCQYWIGESYFGMRDYNGALEAFQKTLLYDKSFKKDDAMLMSGRCYLKLGKLNEAREAFATLIEAFPDSEYRAKAEQYLATLDGV